MAKEVVKGTHKTGKGNWDGMHKFGSGDGTWANLHGWAQFGTKGGGNGIVPKALKEFYKKYNLNPCITSVKLTVDPVKYTVDYEFTIEESPDGKAYVGFSSWGGASGGYPKKLKPASHAYPNYKKEYNGAKENHKGTTIADVIDFYYPGGFRQIFFQFTWPEKYPNLPKSANLKTGTVGVKIGPSGSPAGLPEYNGVLVYTTSVGASTSATSDPLASTPTPGATGGTGSVGNFGTPSVALNVVFPNNFEVKAREDIPKFTIWVGDPQPAEQVEGFATLFDDSVQLDEFGNPVTIPNEYEENEYEGSPEDIEVREANQVVDDPSPPLSTTESPGGSGSGSSGTETAPAANVDVGSTPIGPGPPAGSKLVTGSGKNFYIFNSSKGLAGHRLKNIIPDLQKHLRANGFPDAKIGSNGIMRDIVQSTYPDSPKRAVASLHGAGLAIDVTFSIPGKKWGGIGDNGNLASDANLNKAIWNFVKAQGDITWGAEWGKSKPWDGLVKDWGVVEYHHFEIKSKLIADYWKPFEKDLKAMGFDYTKLNTVGKDGRIYPLFKAILNSKGIA